MITFKTLTVNYKLSSNTYAKNLFFLSLYKFPPPNSDDLKQHCSKFKGETQFTSNVILEEEKAALQIKNHLTKTGSDLCYGITFNFANLGFNMGT